MVGWGKSVAPVGVAPEALTVVVKVHDVIDVWAAVWKAHNAGRSTALLPSNAEKISPFVSVTSHLPHVFLCCKERCGYYIMLFRSISHYPLRFP